MTVTCFVDMHSGGGQKLDWSYIYIEAPEWLARGYFEKRFDRDPDNITCECCGSDYSVSTAPDLAQATAYHRNCGWDDKTKRYVESPRYADVTLLSVGEYLNKADVLFIPAIELMEAINSE